MKTSRIADEDSVSKEIKYIHTYIHTNEKRKSRVPGNLKFRPYHRIGPDTKPN
jgi:hypothetical protein